MAWGPGILSFVVAFVAVRLLLGPLARFALDQPTERSLHERPVPRTGGVAVLLGIASAVALLQGAYWLPLALALVLAALSLVDDLRDMPTPVRLIAHLTAAAVLVGSALWPAHPLEVVLLVLAITWITNLYNFMDGSDGLAGGMALIGFGTYALAAYVAGDAVLAALCVAVAAAAAAFLVHNFPPARIFLGDVGSIPLGFLAGALGLLGWREGLWPLWFPVLVFGPFIGDATITLLRRLARRERVWQAHRDHYYQRLVRMGFGHRGTALIGYAAMAGCAGMALFGRTQPLVVQVFGFLASFAALGIVGAWIELRWSRFNPAAGACACAASLSSCTTWPRPRSPGWRRSGCASTSTSRRNTRRSCWNGCPGSRWSTPPCSWSWACTGACGATPAFPICSASSPPSASARSPYRQCSAFSASTSPFRAARICSRRSSWHWLWVETGSPTAPGRKGACCRS